MSLVFHPRIIRFPLVTVDDNAVDHTRTPEGLQIPVFSATVRRMQDEIVFHMCRREEWQAAERAGAYVGSSQDLADGFIHFSTAAQVRGSAAKHRAGQSGLLLLTVDAAALGDTLKWEPARGGQLFPHLYGVLQVEAVRRVDELPLGDDGLHRFPDHVPDHGPETDR